MVSQTSYLELDEKQSNVMEFIGGQIVPRSGNTHPWLMLDIGRAMPNDGRFEVFSNYRVHCTETSDFLFPNVVVVGKDVRYHPILKRTPLNPLVVVQIVTAANFEVAHFNKLNSYLQIPGLKHGLLVSQEKMFVHHYEVKGAQCLSSCYTKKSQSIELSALGASLSLEKIYRHFDATDAEAEH